MFETAECLLCGRLVSIEEATFFEDDETTLVICVDCDEVESDMF